MNFELTDRCKEYQERVQAFMDEHIYPAEAVYEQQMLDVRATRTSTRRSSRSSRPRPRARGLWNLFHPHRSGARA